MLVADLKAILKKLKLSVKGRKADLVDRLYDYDRQRELSEMESMGMEDVQSYKTLVFPERYEAYREKEIKAEEAEREAERKKEQEMMDEIKKMSVAEIKRQLKISDEKIRELEMTILRQLRLEQPKKEVPYFPIEETEIDTSPKSKGIVINRPKVIKNLPPNPQDIVSKIQRDLDELQSLNTEQSMLYGDRKYHGNTMLIDIAFMAVLEKHKNVAFIIDIKYTGKADTSMAPSRFGIDIALPRNIEGKNIQIDYKQLGIQLQYYSNHDIICVPFNFLERFGAGHANMLIYRPKLGIVEHFEPHGFNYVDGTDPIDKFIKRGMINLWEKQLTPWIGSVKYISTDMICPSYMGLQNISGDMGCLMWSLFAADFALANPDIRLSTLIPTILDISKNEKKYVRNIITGYMVRIQQMLSNILNQEVTHDKASFFQLSGRYEASHGKVNTIIKSNPKIYK
jgi:hypothetical protein